MRLFRIYTEKKNPELVASLIGTFFSSFTMFEARGVWRGQAEPALVIDIVEDGTVDQGETVTRVARKVADMNGQDAVLVVAIELESAVLVRPHPKRDEPSGHLSPTPEE